MMAKTPVVGITVCIDEGKLIRKNLDYFYLKRDYSAAVRRAGAHPVLITPDLDAEAAAALCDGVIISGGDDLPPGLYGEQTGPLVNLESEERINWERKLLDLYGARRGPVLGVCYGLQLINVHFGGSLHQDIYRDRAGVADHGGGGRVTSHRVNIREGSFLSGPLGREATVSSNHHQAVKTLAPGFRVAAEADDGVVEAIERENTVAVEWHPESDATRDAVYAAFVEMIRRGGR